MEQKSEFIVVDTSVLPDVFAKVLEVKRIVAENPDISCATACKQLDISRSAFYKYRDCVFAYNEKLTQRVVNFSVTLKDRAGVLSSLLSALYGLHANILTVTQNVPVDGVALVSLSLKMDAESADPKELMQTMREVPGVIEVRLLSGE